MSNFAMFTKVGMNGIAEAAPYGQLIEIGAFVPVYDYRYDPYIGLVSAASLSSLEISAFTSPDDLYPQGEIIWNTSDSGYSLSESQNYLIKNDNDVVDIDVAETIISEYVHINKVNINTYNGLPITPHYTAEEVIGPGEQDTDWHFKPAALTATDGSNAPPSLESVSLSALFRGVTYQPILLSGTDRRAKFTITCRCPVGQFKFNKLGLYGVMRNANTVVTSNPFLFAQIILPHPQVSYSNTSVATSAGAISDFILECEIDTKAFPEEFTNIWYGTPTEYWNRVINQNGLYGILYDGFVAISQNHAIEDNQDRFTTSAKTTPSKLFISTCENINATLSGAESDLPQLCFQYVDINENRIRTTFQTMDTGDCEVDMYGACTSANVIPSIVPRFDSDIGLGTNINSYKRWDHLNLRTYLEVTDINFEDLNAANVENFMFIVNNNVNVYNGDVTISPYYNGTDRIDNYNYLYGNISSLRVSAASGYRYPNDLLVKSFNDIIFATLSTASDGLECLEIISRLWTMDTQADEGTELLSDRKDMIIASSRNIKIAGDIIPFAYKQSSLGSLDIPMINVYSKSLTTDTIYNFKNSDLLIRSNNDLAIATMTGGNVLDLWKMDNNDKSYDKEQVVIDNFIDYKDILIAADREIRFKGNIVPFKDKKDNIGSPDKYIKELWVDKINCNTIINSNNNTPVDLNGVVVATNAQFNFIRTIMWQLIGNSLTLTYYISPWIYIKLTPPFLNLGIVVASANLIVDINNKLKPYNKKLKPNTLSINAATRESPEIHVHGEKFINGSSSGATMHGVWLAFEFDEDNIKFVWDHNEYWEGIESISHPYIGNGFSMTYNTAVVYV